MGGNEGEKEEDEESAVGSDDPPPNNENIEKEEECVEETAVVNGEENQEVSFESQEPEPADLDGNEDNEDSLNIMIGDEDNLFEDETESKEVGLNGGVMHASPPRPETAPVKHPFTSKDTISLSSRGGKAPSDNSSMLVHPDESSVASHESGDGHNKEGDDKE